MGIILSPFLGLSDEEKIKYKALQCLSTFNHCASKDYGQYILAEISDYLF